MPMLKLLCPPAFNFLFDTTTWSWDVSKATSSTCNISSSKPLPLRRGSKTSSSLPSLLISCTQPTNSLDIFGLNTSTGLFPVSSSSMTTPKLYTSPLNVAIHACPYSGGM
ncbi:uncharacterized protein LOC110826446 [Carica papaya]|uniref:uncharacterized protein LOC110826446 n=1 Tax=Carica papaya TaxID=3649 RepID=UPI000B8CA5CA|nr:uncharacterized protein LOC110826446 [Carica papaya]